MGASEREHGVRWSGGGLEGWTEAADWLFLHPNEEEKKHPDAFISANVQKEGNILEMALEGPFLQLSALRCCCCCCCWGRILAKAGQM